MSITALIAAAFGLAACGGSSGPSNHFVATLNAANEPGTIASSGTGTADYTVDGGVVAFTVTFTGLTTNANNAHIHVGPAGVAGGGTPPLTAPIPPAAPGAVHRTLTAGDAQG